MCWYDMGGMALCLCRCGGVCDVAYVVRYCKVVCAVFCLENEQDIVLARCAWWFVNVVMRL